MANASGATVGRRQSEATGGSDLPDDIHRFITTVAHFHRAEIGRMAGWRDRVDRTSNWAITVVAAMLSLSLSSPTAHHGVLLFAMLLVLLLLSIEARRYRFFDVYRAASASSSGTTFRGSSRPPRSAEDDWIRLLGEVLREPHFLMSHGRHVAAASPELYLDVPYPAARMGAQDRHAEASPRRVQLELVRSFSDIVENAASVPSRDGHPHRRGGFFGELAYITLQANADAGELAHGKVHV